MIIMKEKRKRKYNRTNTPPGFTASSIHELYAKLLKKRKEYERRQESGRAYSSSDTWKTWKESDREKLAKHISLLDNRPCPYCGSKTIKNGFLPNWRNAKGERIQRYKCKTCGKSFTSDPLKKSEPEVAIAVDIYGNPIGKVKVPTKNKKSQQAKPARETPVKQLTKDQKTIRTLNKRIDLLVEKEIQLKNAYNKQVSENLKKDAEIKRLQKEITHLKKTGYFPAESGKDPKKCTRYITINDV